MPANNADSQYTVRGGYFMSEQEERQLLGECAQEVNRLKGELNKITEKLNKIYRHMVAWRKANP